ncbi:MAG: PAAR domain-containing protein [Janthinobacterium lividum]
MRKIIRLGDATSHGGKVVKVAATHFTVGGVPVARVGDKTSCPIHGQGNIVEGEARHTIGGVPVAYEGHRTSCGAMLLPADPHLTCS